MKTIDGAKVLIFSPDKMLLFHRDNIPTINSPDCWCLVGGGIEEGETPEQALVREIKEEVCFNLNKFEFLEKVIGHLGEEVWVYVTFVNKEEEKLFKLGPGEGQKIGWFTIDELSKLKLTIGTQIFFEKYRELVEEMMRTKKVASLVK